MNPKAIKMDVIRVWVKRHGKANEYTEYPVDCQSAAKNKFCEHLRDEATLKVWYEIVCR